MARLVVTAVRIEGRTKSEVARDYGVSRRWVHELVRRYDAEGEAGLEARSRRPRTSPQQTPALVEDEIVELRKALDEQGLDAGAHTIAYHLDERHGSSPAPSTIWRILSRRGFVTPQPNKRPRSSYVRFEAPQPNERWQADLTHWALRGGRAVEILNIVDDHSRLLVGSGARGTFKAADVVATFHEAAGGHGWPSSLLTDNAAVFTAAPRGGGRCAIEIELDALGISLRHSRAYHPQTCGKVERFHQTLKRWLAKQPPGQQRGRAADPAGPVPQLLQHPPSASGPRSKDAGGGVRGSAQSRSVPPGPGRPGPRSGAPRPSGQGRPDHLAVQQSLASHRAGAPAHRGPGPGPGGRSRREGAHRGRGPPTSAETRSNPGLPAAGEVLNVERCPETPVHDVPRHHNCGRWRI
jgi:transposase InsO family protein